MKPTKDCELPDGNIAVPHNPFEINESSETRPMESTTTSTTTTKTERTAEDILQSLDQGEYHLDNLIISESYGRIKVNFNPAKINKYYTDDSIMLSESALNELQYLQQLCQSVRDKDESQWEIESLVSQLNRGK